MILVQEFNRLNTPASRERTQPLKNRRERRQEERDRIRTAKLNQKKVG